MCSLLLINKLHISVYPGIAAVSYTHLDVYKRHEMYRNEYIQKRLREEFPQYDIIVGYMPTGNQAAKLLVEGERSECDISYDLEYGYVEKLKDVLADLSGYDTSRYMEDMLDENHRVIPECRNGGCIAINTEILKKHGLPEPESYERCV